MRESQCERDGISGCKNSVIGERHAWNVLQFPERATQSRRLRNNFAKKRIRSSKLNSGRQANRFSLTKREITKKDGVENVSFLLFEAFLSFHIYLFQTCASWDQSCRLQELSGIFFLPFFHRRTPCYLEALFSYYKGPFVRRVTKQFLDFVSKAHRTI